MSDDTRVDMWTDEDAPVDEASRERGSDDAAAHEAPTTDVLSNDASPHNDDTPDGSTTPDAATYDTATYDTDAAFEGTDSLEDAALSGRSALWDGDSGMLTLAQRRALVRILKKPTITATADPEAWAVLREDEALIRSRLNDLFLDLRIDPNGVAFKFQIRSEPDSPVPPLLHEATYTREETVLLLHLRQRQLTERANGVEHVSVSAEELLEQIALYRPHDAGDKAGDRNRAQKAIESAVRLGALARTTDPDRYLITAVIESVLPAQKLPALLAWFREENRPGATHDHVGAERQSTAADADAEEEAE